MNTDRRSRFRKQQHLRRPADFTRVYAQRNVSRQRGLTLFAAWNDLPYTRVGLSVSRRNGNAVVRNRIKRLFREAFRKTQWEIPPGLDLILVPEKGRDPVLLEFEESLRRGVQALVRRLEKSRAAADEAKAAASEVGEGSRSTNSQE